MPDHSVPGQNLPGQNLPGQNLPDQNLPDQNLPAEPDLDMVMAALRADSNDVAIYAQVLTESLGEAMPPGCVTVERDRRSMADRRHGRPGSVTKVTVRLGDQVLSLGMQRGAPVAEVCREVRGIVLSRQPVPVGQWVTELARALMTHAEQNAAAAQALRRLVTGGGSTGPG